MIKTLKPPVPKQETISSSISFEPLLFAFNKSNDSIEFRFRVNRGIWSAWMIAEKSNRLFDRWNKPVIYEFRGSSSIEVYTDNQFLVFNQLDGLTIRTYPPKLKDCIYSATVSLKSVLSFKTLLLEVSFSDVKLSNRIFLEHIANPVLFAEYKTTLTPEKTILDFHENKNLLEVTCYISQVESPFLSKWRKKKTMS